MVWNVSQVLSTAFNLFIESIGRNHDVNMNPPLFRTRKNPFEKNSALFDTTGDENLTYNSTSDTALQTDTNIISNVARRKPQKASIVKDIRASDYITPQKYLDGAEIPTYYSFQMNLIPYEDQVHGMHTYLEVDRRLTLPTRTHIRFLVTATDVLHSFNCPSLGLKCDALPGRVSRTHTFILREGVFYGQCNEMCGALHGFMPIVIEAVAPETYAAHARKFYRD